MICMDEILEKLYLGGIPGTFDPSQLRELGISHILSLLDRTMPAELVTGFEYKYVYALDLYDTDLLQDLEECLAFLDQGRQLGGVLVHCQAGASRSAAVVIAYIMRTLKLNRLEALELVKNRRPIVKPNEGFLRQLDLFEIMGCRVDERHEEFRRYTLSRVAVRSKSGFHEGTIPASVYLPESSPLSNTQMVYRCRKCRRTLFCSGALMAHGKGQGESAFDWRSKVPANQQQEVTSDDEDEEMEEEQCDMSLFVEPIEWMRGQVETVEGKLGCPKCRSKLGSFVWYGERCPCGAWVAPAFHIQKSKVDAMKPRGATSTNQQIAMPLRPALPLQVTPPSVQQQQTQPLSKASDIAAVNQD